MENSSNNLYIYTDEHKQYRNNLAKKWRNDWKDEFTEEEINTFSPIQLQRLKKNKREKILGEAQQTNEYNEAHNAKVGARKLSQHELLNLLIDKGAAEEEARVIVFGEKKETTGTLETEIEKLVNDKKLQNYPGTTIDYLHSIYTDNEIFTKREENDRVKFLKRVKGWLEAPENIEGVHFGGELVKGAGKKKGGVGYYNSNDYSNADLQDNEEVMKEMIKKITYSRTDGLGVNVPELAFLPLILNMSSGFLRSNGDFDTNKYFSLRVSKTRKIGINSRGGGLGYGYSFDLYLARAVSQSS